jgi:hypothetical protein
MRGAALVTAAYSVIFWGFWWTRSFWMPQLWWDISIPWRPITGRMPIGSFLNALTVFIIAYLGALADRRFHRAVANLQTDKSARNWVAV